MSSTKPLRPYIIPIFISHLGCPFQCLYCQQERITGQEKWIPTPSAVAERVERFLQTRHPRKYSRTEVAFYGGTFTGLPREEMLGLLGAVRPYLENGSVQAIRASTKPDYISQEVLDLLKNFGLTTIELGVQSLEDRILKAVGRGYGAEDVRRAVTLLKVSGFKVGIQLMPGLPEADEEEAFSSGAKAIELKPDFVRIYPTVVLKGTALEQLFYQGRYQPWSLEAALRVCRQLRGMFALAEIPIIKMGLEFSTDEREGIVAGPYHPSFRNLL